MICFIGKIIKGFSDLARRFENRYIVHCFETSGKNVSLGGQCTLSASNIITGDNVYIGPGACFLSSNAKIRIGHNVMFGPNVMIVTGDHRFDVIGKVMFDVTDKRPEDDQDVVIEDDVWVGMGAIILKGVTVGRGSVIAAGTILTRNVPPYSVVYSHSELVIKKRFTDEEIELHEAMLK